MQQDRRAFLEDVGKYILLTGAASIAWEAVLFSAIVSGIAAVMLLYVALSKLRKAVVDMACLDTVARYLRRSSGWATRRGGAST